jgi:hypothetical protein
VQRENDEILVQKDNRDILYCLIDILKQMKNKITTKLRIFPRTVLHIQQ